MKNLDEIKATLSKHKQELKQKYKVKEIGIFGSYVRGEQKRHSDIDLLVEFEEPSSNLTLLDFIRLENYLSEVLGIKVDLVERHALKPRIGKHVLEEVVNV
jgi:predicted nucleotidyltransferase